MIRFGVLGLGFMGRCHLASLAGLDGVEIAAVHDVLGERLNGPLAAGGGNLDTGGAGWDESAVRRCVTVEDVLDGIDAVVIATPSFLHADLACEALSAGKHVFCEKPMALSLADCDRMVAAADAAGRQLMIGHCLRFMGEYVAAADLVRSGRFGRLLSASMLRRCGVPTFGAGGWFADHARSGGPLLDLHIHDVDFTLFMLGAPAAVSATGWSEPAGPNGEVFARYDYGPDGPLVEAAGGWWPGKDVPFASSFRMCFEQATLLYATDGEGLSCHGPQGIEPLDVSPVSGYVAEMAHFVECIRSGARSEVCPPQSSRAAVALALAEAESIRTGRPVGIDPD